MPRVEQAAVAVRVGPRVDGACAGGCAVSAELDEKWRELVAAGRADWVPRMSDQTGRTFVHEAPMRKGAWAWGNWLPQWLPIDGRLPDWSDAATLGALLGQVRKRYMDPTIYARPDQDGWTLFNALGPVDPRGRPRSASSEAGALLCGLELAP